MRPGPLILHVMWRMSIGGAERAVYQLVREQRRRGFAVDVAIATDLGLYGERLRQIGTPLYELRCRGAWDVARSLRLATIGKKYDIVHIHGVEPLLVAAAMLSRRRLVYTHRGGTRQHGVAKQVRLNAARPLVRRFDAISGNTKASAAVAASWLGVSADDVRVVYNGLDFDLLAPARSKADVLAELPSHSRHRFLVGTAANLQRWKRIERLIEAVAVLSKRDVHCLVLGDGPARTDLEQRAHELDVAGRVTFLGRKAHVGDYLQILDAFVLPSGPEEAFGNAAVEAMGVGLPTIIFADGGGLVEHVDDGRTGFVVTDTEGLARALRRLREVPALGGAVGEAGRKHVRQVYSLDAMFKRYDALYASVLERAA